MTEPRTEAGKRLLDFVTALIHPTDPPKPSVIAAIAAIEAEAATAALAEINASEAMWHRRATLAEAALDALAAKVNGLPERWADLYWQGGHGTFSVLDRSAVLALIAEARR